MDEDFDNSYTPPERSTFLTVLCILTFIGSGWSIASSVYQYRRADELDKARIEMIEKNENGVDSLRDSTREEPPAFAKNLFASINDMATKENIERSALYQLIASLFTLGGAILMWRLNRKGFYLYCAGILIALVYPFILYGDNFLAVGITAFGAFFGLIFIALYALNLRQMR